MLFKILAGLAVAWLGWRLWHGWGRPLPGTPTPPPAAPRPMLGGAEAQARALLGLDDAAGPDEIRAAHRRLIAGVHPDRGGSPELARQINAARDTLLKNYPDS